MHPILRNVLAVVAGLVAGSALNMGIILAGNALIPLPEGADVSTMEGLKAALPLFQPKHFITPFLAHALGTFAGAWIAARLAVQYKLWFALGIGAAFLLGGIMNVLSLPAPAWFNALDLIGAYLPMAYLAGKLAEKKPA